MIPLDQQKWSSFSQELQLRHIATELSRAAHAEVRNSPEYRDRMQGAYERALSLIDACLADPKWKNNSMLYRLRDAVSSLYAGKEFSSVSNYLSLQLLEMSEGIAGRK